MILKCLVTVCATPPFGVKVTRSLIRCAPFASNAAAAGLRTTITAIVFLPLTVNVPAANVTRPSNALTLTLPAPGSTSLKPIWPPFVLRPFSLKRLSGRTV